MFRTWWQGVFPSMRLRKYPTPPETESRPMLTTYFTHKGVPYVGRHPMERRPSPSQSKYPHRAVQSYKPKPIAPGDIVRFKNGNQDWRVFMVGRSGFELMRQDREGNNYFRTVDPADEHRLVIVAQEPRYAARQRK